MISPLAYVDPKAVVGQNVTIHPFAHIDADVEIGDNCEIMPYASIVAGTRLGRGVKVFQGAVVGASPQDFRWKGEKGLCIIGDECVIREHVIINRSIREGEATRIGDKCFIMAKSHIGHDCVIQDKCVLGNGVTMAGDVVVGARSILSSNSVFHEGSRIGEWALIKGGCRIAGNVPPYVIIAHNPAAYFGINAYVMKRNGFTEQQIDDVAKAYRHLYQSGSSVFNAVNRILADVDDTPVRQSILDFLDAVDNKIVAVAGAVE